MATQFDEIIEQALMDALAVLEPMYATGRESSHGHRSFQVVVRGEIFTATTKFAALCMAIERCNELDALTERLVR